MRTQVAIVGGGPAGSASSLYLSQRGISSMIIEEDRFPRFHVGESMTGWAAERLRDFGFSGEMGRRRFPVKYGGTVYPMGAASFFVPTSTRVTGTERREVPTWQVRRSDFDQMLLDAALEKGAQLIAGKATEPLITSDGTVSGVKVQSGDSTADVFADVVIDASGRSTWLSRLGLTGGKARGSYANQIAIYSHVAGAIRNPGSEEGNTLLFYRETNNWAWFIPIDPEVVSIGVVVPTEYYRSRKESKEQFFARELTELNPNLAERVTQIELVEDVHATANFSYQVEGFSGPGFLCVGDSHRFIDPFFSFGIHLAISEAEKAAATIARYLDGEFRDSSRPFANFERVCDRGMDTVQDLIDAFWNNPLGWGYMLHYTNYGGDMLDIFGGMIYDDEPSPGLEALRRINRKARAEMAAS
ncbi:MAG: NAD(P)/FAD-dependent oxidoreductase [Acidimicrobiia bacterium]